MTIAWQLPTKRTDGTAVAAGEIKESEVALSAGEDKWDVLGKVAAGASQTYSRDLAPGAYKVRVTAIDSTGQRGVASISDCVVTPAQLAAPAVTVSVS